MAERAHLSLPGVRYALATSIRRVNAAYSRLPEARRPEINSQEWLALEEAIDRHCRRGDRDLALAAIENWEAAALRRLDADGAES